MLFLSVVFHLAAVSLLNPTHGLESVPQAIAPIDAVRHVVNELFSNLKIKIDKNSKIKEYSKIYKYYARITRLENNDWKELVKVTSFDIKIDNGTRDFTTIINEVLNEDNKTETVSDTLNEGIVNKHIEDFLGTLEKLKTLYLRNNSYITINNEVLEQFHKIHGNNTENVELNATESDNDEVWNPSNTRRIYQGQRTRIRTFPFLASVQLFNEFSCAGSIIERDLIITAASCLQLAHNNRFYRENPSFLSVRVGSSFYNGAGEVIPVIEVYFHPSYDPRNLHNNLAIMRLRRKIRLRARGSVKKILIDTNAWTLPPNTDGITIIGWGAKTKTNKMGNPYENKISQANLDFYPLLDCQDIYSRDFVTRKNFCAGFISHGGGACNRDIGAPGVVHGTLTGVVSFGSSTCGSADAPTVFTKLGYYTDWIEEIVDQRPEEYSARVTRRPPIHTHTIMSTRPLREMNFLIEPMDTNNIKSLHELDVRTRNSIENTNELIMLQSDYKELVDEGEGPRLRELNKDGSIKQKTSERKTNKVEKGSGKGGESSFEISHKLLQSFVTKIENVDTVEKKSGEADKSENKNDLSDNEALRETNKAKIKESKESKEKERPTRSTQKEDTNINADMDEKLSSDTDKEFSTLAHQKQETAITSKYVTRELTTSGYSDQPGSKEIAQAIAILSKVINRPAAEIGVYLYQQPANTSVDQESDMEKQIDDLVEEKYQRPQQVMFDPERENEHKKQVIEDTKLLEILENQASEKEPKPSDDNILTLLYLSDNERDVKPANRAHHTFEDSKQSEGMSIEIGNVENLTNRSKTSDQAIAIITNADVYDILADAMGV